MPELKNESERAQEEADAATPLEAALNGPKFQAIVAGIVRDPAIVQRIVGVALRQLHEVKNLSRCTPHTFIACILEAATLGLEIGMNGECWMIPYETPRQSGNYVAQLQIGYLGHLALAWRSDKVAGLQVDVVCDGGKTDGDTFEYQKGTDGFIRHRPRDGRLPSRENITHVYAVIKTIHGGMIWDVFDISQIEEIRRRAPSGDSPAWVDHYAAMAKGKMLKQVTKFAPKSREQATAVTLEEQADARLEQTFTHDVSAFVKIPARSSRSATVDEMRHATPVREAEPAAKAEPAPAAAQPLRAEPAARAVSNGKKSLGW